MDSEKAHDNVPRDQMWYCMIKLGVVLEGGAGHVWGQ